MQSDAPSRKSQITEQFENLDMAIKRNEELITQCAQRFENVLRSEPTIATGVKEPKGPQPTVPMAQRLMTAAKTLTGISDRLESIIQRAEN